MKVDEFELRIERKIQLLRGLIAQMRGVRAGKRFGIGKGVRIAYPGHLSVGDDVTILGFSFLQCLSDQGVRIGNRTSIDRNLWLHCGGTVDDKSHGYFEIGDESFIGCNAVMGAGGGIRIGSKVLIGQSVNIHAENHLFDDPYLDIRDQGVSYKGVVIEDNVWIGSKVTILDGVIVGSGAVIGAGAIVTNSILPDSIAIGNPARVVGTRGINK